VPQGDRKFNVADFSAIEARVIAWLAGEKRRQNVFAEGKDIYCASASQMFGVPVEKHGVNGPLRQKGKIAELALGYGGSVGALKAMGALEMGLSEDELPALVSAWRQSNPKIVQLWWAV
ncbi:DNA polymerase, partial [[Ruminococcus] torques]|uniref:DNA polymerase n=1 Tax=[Ruminococcus] torques TaxID=33039 RepID=UPI0023B1B5E3